MLASFSGQREALCGFLTSAVEFATNLVPFFVGLRGPEPIQRAREREREREIRVCTMLACHDSGLFWDLGIIWCHV